MSGLFLLLFVCAVIGLVGYVVFWLAEEFSSEAEKWTVITEGALDREAKAQVCSNVVSLSTRGRASTDATCARSSGDALKPL